MEAKAKLTDNLVWNAYIEDLNSKKIIPYNIFNNWKFSEYVEKHLKKCRYKDEFATEVKHELMYYFWSKSEYEIVLAPWMSAKLIPEKKIDVYEQVMLNFDRFVDYVWNTCKPRSRNKITRPAK